MDRLNETDFAILDVLSDGDRNVASNIALELDTDRNYINTRFRYLREQGLVNRVGPNERSGLYEITSKGQLVLEYKDAYLNDEIDDFTAFIQSRLADT